MDTALPDGLVLRAAQPADADQIAALITDREGPSDAVDHRLTVDDPDVGWDHCAVVLDGARVVSTALLHDDILVLDGESIPVGQVDFVATDRQYEGRGLVRALMGWAHQRSAARGHLAQVMIGIPYFYRLFGYQYSIPIPRARTLASTPAVTEGLTVRRAGAADIPSMVDLQRSEQRRYDLSMPHAPARWRALVAREGSSQLIVERAGVPVATGRLSIDDGEAVLGEVAATDPPAATALLAHCAAQIGARQLTVFERPGSTGGDALEPILAPGGDAASMYYTRVPDLAALLEHLRPVLSRRLARADLPVADGEALVSLFREHIRVRFEQGDVVEVGRGGRMQSPGQHGGAGVAPDLVGPLLFGPYGITGLQQRHPDVYTGPRRELMAALFPPVRADLLTFYVP